MNSPERVMNSDVAMRSSSSAFRDEESGGALEIVLLGAYDLPVVDGSDKEPIGILVTVCGISVVSGPPTSRHKDRKSFKFSTNNELLIVEKLKNLYPATMTIQMLYEGDNNKTTTNLQAKYELDQLPINQEYTWLVLKLEDQEEGKETSEETNVQEDSSEVFPTIRLKVQLRGPYRPEIAVLLSLCNVWFRAIDNIESHMPNQLPLLLSSAKGIVSTITTKFPSRTTLSTPVVLVPLVTAGFVVVPVGVGVFLFLLPILLPLFIALLLIGASTCSIGFIFWASTSSGRDKIYHMLLEPTVATMHSTTTWQSFMYDTGPRPSPVSLVRTIVPQTIWKKLILSLVIDSIGSFSYVIPGVGEVFDLTWAPTQTIFITAMYDTVSPNLKYVSFVEEMLPFTDIVPSATIGWFMEFVLKNKAGIAEAGGEGATPTAAAIAAASTAITDIIGSYSDMNKKKEN